MRLKQIKLTNFRAIDDAIIEFDGKSTVIFGINGTGKSSILRSVNLLFANIINQVVNRKELKQNYAIQLEDIMYGKREKEKLYLRTVLHIKSFEKHQGQENVCAKWLIYVEMRLITIVEKHKSITIVSELWERFDIIWNESGWT